MQASITSTTTRDEQRILIQYLRGHGDLSAIIRHYANGSDIDDFRCDFISHDMSNIDQTIQTANPHVGFITALPVAPFGD